MNMNIDIINNYINTFLIDPSNLKEWLVKNYDLYSIPQLTSLINVIFKNNYEKKSYFKNFIVDLKKQSDNYNSIIKF
jgi:hypothetical protein